MSLKHKWALGALLVVSIGIISGVVQNSNSTEYVAPVATSTIERVETPDWAEDEDAVEAAKAVVRRKELEAELETLEVELESVETRITEIEKELGQY